MSGKKIITIFGATGNQGGSAVKTFLNDPKLKNEWTVRGVSRTPDSDASKKLIAQGVEVVAANLNDKASVLKATEGSHTVFAVTDYWQGAGLDKNVEIQQGKNLANAAKEAGVQHFIYSSLLNIKSLTNGVLPNVHHFDGKAEVEQYVRDIGIPATFFLPGFFMSNLPGGMLRPLPPNNSYTLALPIPASAPIPLFDTVDTGKWIKAIVLHRSNLLGKRVIAATAYVTPQEIVDQFKEVYPEAGKDAVFFSAPQDVFLGAMKGLGLPEFAQQAMLENFLLFTEAGYFGGESLDKSQALVEEPFTTWKDHLKSAPAFAELK